MQTYNKAVLYIRLSTLKETLDVRLGAEAQRKACRDYCTRQNIQVIGEFEEIVSACTTFSKRLVFPKVIETCCSNNASLMVAFQDRLTRNLDDWTGFTSGRLYGKRTPQLICVESPNSSSLERDVKAIFAQYERDRIAQRTRDALAVKKAQGHIIGEVGRIKAAEYARKATEEAKKKAIELREEGRSYQKIADELNRQGFTTSRGTPWSHASVFNRLRNIDL